MKLTFRTSVSIFSTAAILFCSGNFQVLAEETNTSVISDEINELHDVITEKKSYVDQLNRKIDDYRDQIEAKQQESATLQNEMEILTNRIAASELEVEVLNEEIEAVNLEISAINMQIADALVELERQKDMIVAILQEMQVADDYSTLDLVFAEDSFSELFDQLQYLQNINVELKNSVEQLKGLKGELEQQRVEKETRVASLEALETKLEQKIALLEDERNAKEVLLAQTQASEATFATLLYELRQEQYYIEGQISALQSDIEQRLYDSDVLGDLSVLTWPFAPEKGISATFHDPTYPYRHLFEHPGIDLPIDVGTPVGSAAPGYVAWTRQGTMYGNYVMVIHVNGIATLYAHLSKISVEADQFVARGEAVGLSGGRPGMAGAGLSTGPHLHFEVRKDGIPVNPLDYLISL